jgi:hypothetical protein
MPTRPTLVRDERGKAAGLNALVRNLNMIPSFSGDMASAWKKAEEVISNAVPPPGVPEGYVESEHLIQTPLFGEVKVKGLHRSFLGHRKPSLVSAAYAFNRWAQEIPVQLEIRVVRIKGGKAELSPDVKTSGAEGLALWMVWRCLFVEEWQRLRRCPTCHKWFVDTTRNKVMVRCSKSCTDKWWTLDRRRAQGHRSAKRRATK